MPLGRPASYSSRSARSWRWLVVIAGLAVCTAHGAVAAWAYDWPQFDGDPQHSGNNTQEAAITTSNVHTLHTLFAASLHDTADGAPAYLGGVSTPSGTRDLLFVTTKQGWIQALDAHSGTVVWQQQYGSTNYTTSSPAIDPNRQFVYTYGLDGDVHKLRVGDGGEVTGSGWPELATRKPDVEKGSSALSVSTSASGTSFLYVANGGYPGDAGDYQGHLTTINLATGGQHVFNTLCSTQTDVHFVENASPDCGQVQSAVWARAGAVYDSVNNRIYIATGNGDYNPGNHDWGDSVLALGADGTGNSGVPLDSYTPTDYASLQSSDADLGSTAPAILPTPANSNVQHLAVQGGKDAKLRLLNLDNLSGHGGPGYTGGEVGAVINVPQGGEVLTAPAVWVNPIDNSTWVFVANGNGISGLRLMVDGSGNPSLATQWTLTTGGTSPLIANGVLYYAHSNAIQALNPLNGALLWQNTSIGGIHWQGPVVANGTLYIEDNSAHLTAFNLPAPAATITASPNPVPSSSNTTTISWNTGDGSIGQVYVSVNSGSESLFAQGSSGSASAPWISSGSTYVFKLYAGTSHTTVLATTTVTRSTASLSANPNPVPAGSGVGTTTISWNTGDGSSGQVYVSQNGGGDALFTQGSSGAATAPWIISGSTYVFSLYAGTGHTTKLASVTVTRATATLTASPNPVPSGSTSTTISWNTGDGSSGQVYVSQNGGGDVLFTQGSSGSATAPWINAGSTYVFSLYAGTGHSAKLASVTVTHAAALGVMEQKWAISVQNHSRAVPQSMRVASESRAP